MPRQVFYLGKWIRHSGWYPDRKIRLFLKDKARWEGEYIHERLIIEGKIQKLENSIHHFTYRNISEHLSRINKFSDLGAQKLYTQKSKCRWYHLVFMPFFRFAKSFIFRAGFLDGYAGFIISVLHGYAIFARYSKLREIWKKGERIEPFPYWCRERMERWPEAVLLPCKNFKSTRSSFYFCCPAPKPTP